MILPHYIPAVKKSGLEPLMYAKEILAGKVMVVFLSSCGMKRGT